MAAPKVRQFTKVGKGGKEAVQGLKELEAKLKALGDSSAGPEAQKIIREACRAMYQQVISSAESVNIPHEAMADIFMYSRQHGGSGRKKDVSGLVGLRKRGRSQPWAHGYVEWYPGREKGKYRKTQRSARRDRRLVMPGTVSAKGAGLQKIGESLATMWELGTTKKQAKPFFRSAVQSAKLAVLDIITNGMRDLIAKTAKGNA